MYLYVYRENFSLIVPSSFHLDVVMLTYDVKSLTKNNNIQGLWACPNMKNKIYKQNWWNKQ